MRLEYKTKEIINYYLNNFSLRKISKIFKIDRKTVKKILLNNNIKLRTLSECNKIYKYDENIFEKIDSHEKAYWLGFIASDGCIYKNSLKILLSIKDIEHLNKFNTFMKSNKIVKVRNQLCTNNNCRYETCYLQFNSIKIVEDLKKLNIIQNKSKILQPSIIEEKYYNSYILGLIDGDGCFSLDKKNNYKFNIISSFYICEFINITFNKLCNVSKTKIIKEKRSDGLFYYYAGGNNKIKKIVNFLYKNSSVYLERKFNIIKDLIITH